MNTNILIEKVIAFGMFMAIAMHQYLAGILGAIVYVSMRHELGHTVGIKNAIMATMYGLIGGYGGIHLANEYLGVTSETVLNIIGFAVGFLMYEILLGAARSAPDLVSKTIGNLLDFISTWRKK